MSRGDESAGALASREQARLNQTVERLTDGDPRDIIGFGEVALRRQRLIRREDMAVDRSPQQALQLKVKWRPAFTLQFSDAVDEHQASFSVTSLKRR
jgi:hypothetical protein